MFTKSYHCCVCMLSVSEKYTGKAHWNVFKSNDTVVLVKIGEIEIYEALAFLYW